MRQELIIFGNPDKKYVKSFIYMCLIDVTMLIVKLRSMYSYLNLERRQTEVSN